MFELRPYQAEGIEAIRASLRRHRRVLYTGPTGSGKGCMIAFMVAGASAKGKRICLAVHRHELVMDLSGRLDGMGVPHHLIVAGSKPACAQVNVASVQTWARRLGDHGDFDLIIIDEGHHAVEGNTWGRCLAANPQAKVVAFSASPQRLDGRGLAGTFDDLVIGPSVRELIDGGFLADYVAYAPADGGPDLSGVRTKLGDYDLSALADRMSKAELIGDAVGHYAKHVGGRPAIAFCVTVAHAEMVAAEFRAAGFSACSVDGSLGKQDRARRIGGLADGSVQVLTSCALISEGLDVPAVTGAILLRPTQSLALAIQQVGRALRPKPDGARAVILDHAGLIHRHGLPCAARTWKLTADREKKKAEPVRMCPKCFAYAPASARECPECGFAFERGEGRELPTTTDGELVEIKPRLWAEDGRPAIERSRKQIDEAARACRSFDDLRELRKALGFRPGWEAHVARGLGWVEGWDSRRGRRGLVPPPGWRESVVPTSGRAA